MGSQNVQFTRMPSLSSYDNIHVGRGLKYYPISAERDFIFITLLDSILTVRSIFEEFQLKKPII